MSKEQASINLGNAASSLRKIALWLAGPDHPRLKNRINQFGQSVIETLAKTQLPLSKFHPYNQLLIRLTQDVRAIDGNLNKGDSDLVSENALYLSVRLSNLSQLLVR